MKKTLLLISLVALSALTLNAEGITKVWSFATDATNWPIKAGIGNGDGTTNNPVWPVNIDGLLLTGPSATPPAVPNVNMGQIEASSKTFNSIVYPNRFKFNGGGYPGAAVGQTTPSVAGVDYFMPTQRFISFSVVGNSEIKAIAITGSTGSERYIFVTDGKKLIGSIIAASDAVVNEYVVNYTGPATKLYLFCNAAVNLYSLSATNYDVSTSVKTQLTDKGIAFNGSDITNAKGLNIEVFNVLGKSIAKANTSISTANFQRGIYIVRIAGTNETLKFSI